MIVTEPGGVKMSSLAPFNKPCTGPMLVPRGPSLETGPKWRWTEWWALTGLPDSGLLRFDVKWAYLDLEGTGYFDLASTAAFRNQIVTLWDDPRPEWSPNQT